MSANTSLVTTVVDVELLLLLPDRSRGVVKISFARTWPRKPPPPVMTTFIFAVYVFWRGDAGGPTLKRFYLLFALGVLIAVSADNNNSLSRVLSLSGPVGGLRPASMVNDNPYVTFFPPNRDRGGS